LIRRKIVVRQPGIISPLTIRLSVVYLISSKLTHIRRHVIERLMCDMWADLDATSRAFNEEPSCSMIGCPPWPNWRTAASCR
jgi:hypothetical protein